MVGARVRPAEARCVAGSPRGGQSTQTTGPVVASVIL
jgi:hypothetical protein